MNQSEYWKRGWAVEEEVEEEEEMEKEERSEIFE